MFGHDFNEFPYFVELHDRFPSDKKHDFNSGCSSYVGCPCSTNSYGIYSSTIVQRSISSDSIHKNMEVYAAMNFPDSGCFESEISSLSSTGDLQSLPLHNQWPNSPLASESSITECMSKASRYSPDEKKERIERYRSKRNLRNFNKKIQYKCRKTLADRRPRVRGRFAKNDAIEKVHQSRWDRACVAEDNDDWISFLDALSANMMPN